MLEAFRSFVGSGRTFCEVRIEPQAGGYELRHAADFPAESGTYVALEVSELREWALADAAGAFRPLKSAPTLRKGWICRADSLEQLWEALEGLYPGAIGDWYAVEKLGERGQGLRPYLERQTGIYRTAKLLDETTLGELVHSCCDARVCLKRRVWEAGTLGEDAPAAKSDIPCVEPCAVLLEGARRESKAMGFNKVVLQLGKAELESLEAALAEALNLRDSRKGQRVGDLADPLNPRRILLALHRVQRQVERETAGTDAPKG